MSLPTAIHNVTCLSYIKHTPPQERARKRLCVRAQVVNDPLLPPFFNEN